MSVSVVPTSHLPQVLQSEAAPSIENRKKAISRLPKLPTSETLGSFGPMPIHIEKHYTQSVTLNYRLLTLAERFSLSFRCRNHNFSWPHTRRDTLMRATYPKGFDSHQHCTSCGAQRFYNAETLKAGAFFLWTDSGSRDLRQQKVS
jgi:hypothetical protein